jgi:hypothetical protein
MAPMPSVVAEVGMKSKFGVEVLIYCQFSPPSEFELWLVNLRRCFGVLCWLCLHVHVNSMPDDDDTNSFASLPFKVSQ